MENENWKDLLQLSVELKQLAIRLDDLCQKCIRDIPDRYKK